MISADGAGALDNDDARPEKSAGRHRILRYTIGQK